MSTPERSDLPVAPSMDYESEQEARDYVTANSARIQDKLRLHMRVDQH